ncbi:MAG TPA: hypothetical protein VH373_20245 [Jatrophihabitantaceae bacterium]
MLLWIFLGVVAIALLGLACSWVLKARGGFESVQYTDPDALARAKANVLPEQNTYGNI